MLRKKKRCSNCKQECFLWGKQLCKKCFSALYPPKPIKKVSKKGIEKKSAKKELLEEDFKLYKEIWNERPHYCYETGKWLGNEPLTTMFHHVLFKHDYPLYRHEKWNIVLLSPDIHSQVHSDMDKTPKVKALMKELLNNLP